jgi:hypothetical protein
MYSETVGYLTMHVVSRLRDAYAAKSNAEILKYKTYL